MDNLIKQNKIVLSCFYKKKKKKIAKGLAARFLLPVLHEPCGPTLVLGVHEIAIYARFERFSMLKKPNFNSVLGFCSLTSQSGLGLRALLTSSLPLILSGLATRKGKYFHARVILLLFSLKNQKLGTGFSYSHLRIHDFFKEFLITVFVVCKIRKLVSLYIYNVLRSFKTVLVFC